MQSSEALLLLLLLTPLLTSLLTSLRAQSELSRRILLAMADGDGAPLEG